MSCITNVILVCAYCDSNRIQALWSERERQPFTDVSGKTEGPKGMECAVLAAGFNYVNVLKVLEFVGGLIKDRKIIYPESISVFSKNDSQECMLQRWP